MSDTTDNVGARKETTSRSSTPGRSQVPSTDSTENDPSTPISSAPAESENLQPSQPTQPTQPNLTLAQTLASILTAAGMSSPPVNPRPWLQSRVGTDVVVRLKWGQTEYKGYLQAVDSYMNVLLHNAVEYIDGQETGAVGMVLIRCNNILWMGDSATVQMTNLGL